MAAGSAIRRSALVFAAAGMLASAAIPVRAEPARVTRPAVPAMDQEAWAGITYRETLIGLAVLGGGAIVVGWLTGSAISGISAAAAVAAGYLIFDPEPIGVLNPRDLPTLPDLAVNAPKQH